MKYFFDTEFIEDGKTIDLISIGIVAEDDREYYALNFECDWAKASGWVKNNVLCHLPERPKNINFSDPSISPRVKEQALLWKSRNQIASDIKNFVFIDDSEESPEFWAYFADYDWVAFCQLFGTMMDLPQGFPGYCRDVKQLCDDKGNPKLPQQELTEHHALNDARWTKQAYLWLCHYKQEAQI